MADFTGDSSSINLSNPIVITTPNDGAPASIGSSLGIGTVFQRIANFLKALVLRGDGHNTRLLAIETLNPSTRLSSIEAKVNPAGVNALWHQGNLKFFEGSFLVTISGTTAVSGPLTIAGARIGDFCICQIDGGDSGVTTRAWVSAANVVQFHVAGPNLPPGSFNIRVLVIQRF